MGEREGKGERGEEERKRERAKVTVNSGRIGRGEGLCWKGKEEEENLVWGVVV